MKSFSIPMYLFKLPFGMFNRIKFPLYFPCTFCFFTTFRVHTIRIQPKTQKQHVNCVTQVNIVGDRDWQPMKVIVMLDITVYEDHHIQIL